MTERIEVVSAAKQGPGGPGASPAPGPDHFLVSAAPGNAYQDADPAAARAALNVQEGATANASDAALRDRATHTGEQPMASITGLVEALNAINALLASDDVSLDELQEVVDFIKQNRDDLDALAIANIAGLEDALAAKLDASGYTPADVRAKLEAAADSHVLSDALKSKLESVEPNADVTDPALVEAVAQAGLAHKRLDGLARRGQVQVANASAGPWFTASGNTAVVSLEPPMERADYMVDVRVRSATPSRSLAGDVDVISQAVNAFTVRVEGSARDVVIDWRITA